MAIGGNNEIKAKVSLDKSQALADAISLETEIKKKLGDLRTKVSTSIDFKEIDKLKDQLKGLTDKNTALNLSVKVQNSGELEKVKQELKDIGFGEPKILRFNVKQDSNIFNQINLSIKDTNTKFSDLQNSVAALKISPKVEISEIKTLQKAIEDSKSDLLALSKQGIDIKTDVSKIKELENSLKTIEKEVVKVSSTAREPITVKINNSLATRELDAINQKLQGIKSITATGLILKFSEIGLGAIASTLGAIKGGAGDLFAAGGQLEKQLIVLDSTSKAFVNRQNDLAVSAKQGKVSIDQLAEARGVSTASLYEDAKARGGVAGATKGLRSELDKLKDSKRDLGRESKVLLEQDQRTIDSTEKIIKSIEDKIKATDKEIKKEQEKIDQKQGQLDNELKKKEDDLNIANKPELRQIKQRELEIRTEINTLQKKENVLNDNKKANQGELQAINDRQEALRAEQTDLNIKRDTIRETISIEIDKAKSLQDAKQDEIDNEQKVLDLKKAQANQDKNNLEDQIETQKTKVEQLKTELEAKKIKLEFDTSKLEDQIIAIQDKVDRISISSSGGGGGSTKILSAQGKALVDELSKINSQRKIDGLSELTPGEIRKQAADRNSKLFTRINKVDETSSLNQSQLITASSRLGLQGFADNPDKFEKTVRVLDDLLQSEPNADFKDALRSLTELKQGDFNSIKENFGISKTDFEKAALQVDKKAKTIDKSGSQGNFLAQFGSDQLVQILEQVNKNKGFEGLGQAASDSFPVQFENLQTQTQKLGLEFIGINEKIDKSTGLATTAVDPEGLFASAKSGIKEITSFIKSEDGKELKKSLSDTGKQLGQLTREALSSENIKNFGDAIKDFAKFIESTFNKDNTKKISDAITDLAEFVADPLADRSAKKAEKLKKEFDENQAKIKNIDVNKLSKEDQEKGISATFTNSGNFELADKSSKNELGVADRTRILAQKPGIIFGGAEESRVGGLELGIEAQKELLEIANKQIEAQKVLDDQFKKTAETFRSSYSVSSQEIQNKITTAFFESTRSSENFTKTSDEKLQLFVGSLKTSFETIPAGVSKILDDTNLTTEQKLQIINGTYGKSFDVIKSFGIESFKDLNAQSSTELEALIAKIQGDPGKSDEEKKGATSLVQAVIAAKNTSSELVGTFKEVRKEGEGVFDGIIKGAKDYINLFGGKIQSSIDDVKKNLEGKVGGQAIEASEKLFDILKPKARATGGPVSVGENYLINEEGQEMFLPSGRNRLFSPTTDGQIINAKDTKKYLSAMKNYQNTMYNQASRDVQNTYNNQQARTTNNITQVFNIQSSGSGSADSVYLRNMAGNAKSNALLFPNLAN